jgi:hypothetical protein
MRTLCHFVLFTASIISLYSQTPTDTVTGYRGQLEVVRSATGLETRIVLTADTVLADDSSQAVFVLQHSSDTGPLNNVSTRGRVLLSDGILAIIGDDGTKRMFKFPERAVPPSLSGRPFTMIPVYGIARYYDKSSSTSETPAVANKRGLTTALQGMRVSPSAIEACPEACNAGGEGATSCSLASGGFTSAVTCGATFHACCWMLPNNNSRCACCKD